MIRGWSKEIILIFIGAGLTFLGQYGINSIQSDVLYIDKYVENEKSILSQRKLVSHDVKVFVDEKEIEKVSKINVALVNYSRKSYSDLEILIKIDPGVGDINVLSAHAVGENGEKGMVTELKSQEENTYLYSIKSAKRTEKYEEFLKMVIYYEGELDVSEDDVIVTVTNSDPRVRNYDSSHSPETISRNVKELTIVVVLSAIMVVCVLIVIGVLSRLTSGFDRSRKKYSKKIYEAALRTEMLESLKDLDVRKKIIGLLYEHQITEWREKNIVSRFIEGNVPPKREDFDFDDDSSMES